MEPNQGGVTSLDEKPLRQIDEIDPSVNEFSIIDADFHIYDALEDLVDFIDDDSPWKRRFEQGSVSSVGNSKSISSFFPTTVGSRSRYGRIKREHDTSNWDKEVVKEAMDYLSIDDSVMIGTNMLLYGIISSQFEDWRMREHAEAYTQRMIADFVDPAEGINMVLPIPYQQPDIGAEFIDDWADESGIVGCCLVTPGAEPPLGHYSYDPIYQAAQDAGLPILYHSGGAGLNEIEKKGYQKLIETHTLGFMSANLSQLTSIIIQGIPERYPDIDFVFVESGIAYVVALMFRLDSEYMKRQDEAPLLTKRPSEYIKEDIYFGTQPLEQPENINELGHLIRMMGGPQNLIYSSDYPHWDYDPPSIITQLPFLSKNEKELILSKNALEVFDFD